MNPDNQPAPPPGEATDARDPVGRVLADRYRVAALIARGGMARAYRARDERLERDVALKILSDPYAQDPAFVERFLGEARAAASLTHPSLLHVYDSGSDGDLHFIVMELLDRHRSLRDVLDARGPLGVPESVGLARELLSGLRLVHERGLVHCDVKAGNVMLGPGPAKLIDFGIARTPTAAGDPSRSLGSLPYMSPEQLRGEQLTPASDLFALGVVLYEAITGRLPFEGRTPAEVAAAQRAESIQPPSALADAVPDRLDRAILQVLRTEPMGRFQSAEAMDRALEASLSGQDADETEVLAPMPAAASAAAPPRAPRPPPVRAWSVAGTSIPLVAAAAVVLLVVVPLLQLGRGPGGSDAPAAPTASAASAPTPLPATVAVPDTIGLSTPDAIQAASTAGLDWTVRCEQDPRQPEGIIDQEPPAGTPVERGARFTMYSARIADCR